MTAKDSRDADDVPARFHVQFEGRTLLGLYRVERRLADGGMGSVYLAQDTNLNRRVVVKVPHVRFLGEPGFRSRFRREISELVRLEHPHVVRILAQGEEDEIPYFVLQYLGGGSLEDRAKRGPEAPEASPRWLTAIAETLDFVHGRGVIHRDVKPANILFDEQGHVFLSDFGVVKALEHDGSANLTELGTGVGSPLYMAPEQAIGRAISPASDQYALASTLYEALAGEPPFGRGAIVETILKKDREAAPSVRTKAPSVPEACAAAIARALAKDADARFPSCAAFADAYRAGVAGATTATTTGPAARSPRRALVAAALIALAAAAGGVGAATQWFGLAGGAASPSEPRSGGGRPASASDGPHLIAQLVKPGAEPRRALRLRYAPGSKETASAVLDEKFSIALDGGEPKPSGWTAEQAVDVRVTAVEPDGRAKLEWVMHEAHTVVPDPSTATPSEKTASSEKQEGVFGDVIGTSFVSTRGIQSDAVFRFAKPPDTPSPFVSGTLSIFEELARTMTPALPEEPIGVGAEWDVSQFLSVYTMRYQRTTTYTLLESYGDHLRLAIREDFTAPRQGMEFGEGIKAPTTTLRSFTGSGEGEMVLVLTRPMPLSSTAKGAISWESSAMEGGVEHRARFEKSFAARVKR